MTDTQHMHVVGRDARVSPFRLIWDDFSAAGVDNFSKSPTPEMFDTLENVMPVVDVSLDRRWGYRLWYDDAVENTEIGAYLNENTNNQYLVGCSLTSAKAFTEAGASYRSSIFSTSGNSRVPTFVNSRSFAFFADGSTTDYKKWNGADSGGVYKWGVDINDTSSTATQGPTLPGTAADQGASGGSGSAGPNLPFTGSNDSSAGVQAWATPENITAEDDAVASAIRIYNNPDKNSQILHASDFGFAIPSTATISGIVIEVKWADRTATLQSYDLLAQLYKGGTLVGNNNASLSNPGGTLTWQSYGNSADLWGTSWAYSDINASDFGFGFRVENDSGTDIDDPFSDDLFDDVDAIRATVYYTIASTSSWTSPNNIKADDSTDTTATVSTSATSELRASNFGFTIAATAAISGIKVDIDIHSLGGVLTLAPILVKGGVVYGTRKTLEIGSTGVYSFGGSSDLWGGAFSPGDVNASDFGAQFYAQTSSGTVAIGADCLKITVYAVTGPIALGATSGGAITLNSGRKYAASFKTSSGEYSSMSPASASTGALAAKQQALSSIPQSNDSQVSKVAILATADGGDETLWYLITEINNATTTYTDNMPEATLLDQPIFFSTDESGNEFGVVDNDPPPVGSYLPTKHRGRIYMTDGNLLYWSKNLGDLTTSSGFIAGLWESAWPIFNRQDVTEGAESVRGLLSDGQNIYIGTQYRIKRFSGDAPFDDAPDIVHNHAGLLNQRVWKIVFREQAPVGAIWLTPDKRVIYSDFNTYAEIGMSIQTTLNSINGDAAATYAQGIFFSQGPYDFYALAIPTESNTRCDTICLYNLRSGKWVTWQLSDTLTGMYSGFTSADEALWVFASGLADVTLTNGGFETGTTSGWTLGTGYSIVASNPNTGTYALKYLASATASTDSTTKFGVQPGQLVTATCKGKRTSGVGTFELDIKFETAAHGAISTTSGTASTSSSYATLTTTATAPATAAYAYVSAKVTAVSSTTVYFDDFAVQTGYKFYKIDDTATQDRVGDTPISITSTIRTPFLDFGDSAIFKTLNEIELMTSDSSATVTVEKAKNRSEFDSATAVVTDRAIKLSPFSTYKVYLASSNSVGRFHRITVTSTSTVSSILDSLNIEVAPLHRL